MSPYKYFTSSSPVYFSSTGSTILNEFQEFLNVEFFNAPDAFVIQEETVIGSGSYANVDVRVNTVIDSATGKNLGDDWKKLIFKDLAHSVSMGVKFYFDSNYWVTVNTERLKNFAASCTVRRCNNTLS